MKSKGLLQFISGFVILIYIGEILGRYFAIPKYLVPLPSDVFVAFTTSYKIILSQLFITLGEAFAGFSIALIVGISIATILDNSKILKQIFQPYVLGTKLLPTIALTPLLVIWLGNGSGSKIAAAAIASLFYVVTNLLVGFQEISPELTDLTKSLSAKRWQTFSKIRFPNAIPYLFTSMKLIVITSITATLVAEFVGSNKGLGFLIMNDFYYLRTDSLFASILALFITGLICYKIVEYIERLFFSKYRINHNLE